jgi:probable phosphoglycerate mutase
LSRERSERVETMGDLWLVRHGQTEWSRNGRHTSTTDLPLLPEGEDGARALAPRLAEVSFAQVLTSPRLRARDTARLAGFPDAEVDPDLAEWDYGDYEGITSVEIQERVPGWTIWTHPCPGGETADEVGSRFDRVVERASSVDGDTLVFSHGHASRVLAARWLELSVGEGRLFHLDTSTLSVLGHEGEQPVVLRWNS